eukprot:8261587-Pyramimonas_sp.AAC.1
MCAALRLGWRASQTSKRRPPSIREARASVRNDCARRQGESHILRTARPQSVKLLLILDALRIPTSTAVCSRFGDEVAPLQSGADTMFRHLCRLLHGC